MPVLAAGRARVAQRFVDTCTIRRVTGVDTNLITGVPTKTKVIVYDGGPANPGRGGPCRIQQAAAPWAGPATVGQAAIRLAALELQLPVVGSEHLAVDDEVTIDTCAHDTELVGRVFVIVGLHHASEKTTRRLPLQEKLS